ncbi:hypothetical protein, partial [Aneurinibacillus migulanus]|uniref:hypothetical protein n=1 Tax=Aneurinibacillus migulanus TaxID=47500 RepID=UPI001C46B189
HLKFWFRPVGRNSPVLVAPHFSLAPLPVSYDSSRLSVECGQNVGLTVLDSLAECSVQLL